MEYILNSLEETIELGKKIGNMLKGGELFLLEGDLGGGKTQFTKGLAAGLGIEETVVSPTFTIERIYKAKELELHHFDFYRLNYFDQEMSEELEELISDPKNIVVIEWPKNLKFNLPKSYIEMIFQYLDEKQRKIELNVVGERYKKLLEKV